MPDLLEKIVLDATLAMGSAFAVAISLLAYQHLSL